jgi:hypothetical protein
MTASSFLAGFFAGLRGADLLGVRDAIGASATLKHGIATTSVVRQPVHHTLEVDDKGLVSIKKRLINRISVK